MTDSLDDIWRGDLLGRRGDAHLLQDFLIRRHSERVESGEPGAYVVNLNAAWGHGKSFFMERLAKQLDAAGYPTAFVNAWRDDSSKEPVVAVMAAIEASLKPHFAKQSRAKAIWAAAKANSAPIVGILAKGVTKKVASKLIGDSVEELGDALADKAELSADVSKAIMDGSVQAGEATASGVTTLLTKYIDQKISDYQTRVIATTQFQNRMRDLLSSLSGSGDVKVPFFVLIDELDRCRPTYAIEMLEQVKHLFDIDNTIFIISTDGDQLSHSVKAVYGEGFDGKRYLLRFFHRHYKFEKRDTADYVRYLFDRYSIDMSKIGTPFATDPAMLFSSAMESYRITLRDSEQCFDILRTIATTWEYPTKLQLNLLLPLIVMYQRHDMEGMESYFENTSRLPSAGPEWTVTTTTVRDDFRRSSEIVSVPVESLNSQLISQAKRPLREMFDYAVGTPQSRYISQVLHEEIGEIHRNQVSSNHYSIISNYPAIVRRLGRLTDTGSTTDGAE